MTLLDSIAAMPQLHVGGINDPAIQYFATPWGGTNYPPASAAEAGRQIVVRFANGFGASIICYPNGGSYGGKVGAWELMPLTFRGNDWFLAEKCDPTGWIDSQDVIKFLRDIADNGVENAKFYNDGFVNQEV